MLCENCYQTNPQNLFYHTFFRLKYVTFDKKQEISLKFKGFFFKLPSNKHCCYGSRKENYPRPKLKYCLFAQTRPTRKIPADSNSFIAVFYNKFFFRIFCVPTPLSYVVYNLFVPALEATRQNCSVKRKKDAVLKSINSRGLTLC